MDIGLPFSASMKKEERYVFIAGAYTAISWTILGCLQLSYLVKISVEQIFYVYIILLWLFCTLVISYISIGIYLFTSYLMNKHIVQVEEIAELKRKALHMTADQKLFVDLDVFKERPADTFLHVLFIVTTIATFYPLEMVGRKLIQYEYLTLFLIVPAAVLIYTAYQGLYYQCAVSRLKTEGQIEFFDIKKFAEKMGDLHAVDARRIFFKD